MTFETIKTALEWLIIKKPLFYNAPNGLRFEIGNPNQAIENPKYLKDAVNRSLTLYETLFGDDDSLYLITQMPADTTPDAVEACFKKTCVPLGTELFEHLYDSSETAGAMWRLIYELDKRHLDAKALFEGICSVDLGEACGIDAEVYLVKSDLSTTLHLYDDRGMDVVANTPEALRPLYNQYSRWLLAYDRERIDAQFRR